jgi:parallel beta-helix repeat protein
MKKQAGFVFVFVSLTVICLLPVGEVFANFTPLPTLPTPVYILSDGRIDPQTAPVQHVGNVYTLIGNINNTLEIQCSNIVLEGSGFTISKPDVNTEGLMMPIGWLPGVHISNVNNVTVRNVTFEKCITGVTIENVSSITVSECTVQETLSGIVVSSASNITIANNTITLVKQSFATAIHLLPSPNQVTIEGNQITGTSTQVPPSPPQPSQYGIWGGCVESQIIGNNFSSIEGIALYYTGSNCIIAGNNFVHNNEGLFISSQSAANNIIFSNNFDHNSENAIVPFIRDVPINFWDNGTVGNYWSNYTGTDLDGNGLGDIPHLIETTYYNYTAEEEITLLQGQDNYPVMAPLPLSNGTVTLPITQPSASPEATSQIPECPTALAATVLIAASVVIAALMKKENEAKPAANTIEQKCAERGHDAKNHSSL